MGAALWPVIGWWAAAVALALVAALGWSADRRAPSAILTTVGARPASAADLPRVHNVVDGLCATLGLRAPLVHIVERAEANALAVGRGPAHAHLVVTRGLVDALSRIELEAIVARLLVAVKQHDVQLGTLVSATALAPVLLADRVASGTPSAPARLLAIPATVLGPLGERLAARALPERREVLLDLAAASITRYPPGLVAALDRLGPATAIPDAPRSSAHLWIVDPRPSAARDAAAAEHGAQLEERLATLREL